MRFLHDTLSKEGYRVVLLHGDRSQPERDEAMRSFRGGKAQVRGRLRGCLCVCVYVCVWVWVGGFV